MKNIFFRRGAEVLLLIDGQSDMIDISFAMITPYCLVHSIINKFEQEDIISTEIKGRNREIILTKKGVEIKKLLIGIKSFCSEKNMV